MIDPHANGRLFTRGAKIEDAKAVLVMIHGRGASANDILSLYDAFALDKMAAIAPQAMGNTWYPNSFLAPIASNQPWLDSALSRIETIVDDLLARGIQSERIALLGFSQGACLTSEFIARHPRRYGAACILTGGVIGPIGMRRDDQGDLAGTPVFLGTSDRDPHVPLDRAEETAAILTRMKATVDLRIYPGMPHTVNEDEIDACRTLLKAIV